MGSQAMFTDWLNIIKGEILSKLIYRFYLNWNSSIIFFQTLNFLFCIEYSIAN